MTARLLTPTQLTWYCMRDRCHNPKHRSYHNYGGRGITVCDRWRTSFANFLADMGERPSRAHTLDRHPNKNGNYEPGNCRWATQSQQQRNRRDRTPLTAFGRSQLLVEWLEEFGISSVHAVHSRLKRGWTLERALTVPVGAHNSGRDREAPVDNPRP